MTLTSSCLVLPDVTFDVCTYMTILHILTWIYGACIRCSNNAHQCYRSRVMQSSHSVTSTSCYGYGRYSVVYLLVLGHNKTPRAHSSNAVHTCLLPFLKIVTCARICKKAAISDHVLRAWTPTVISSKQQLHLSHVPGTYVSMHTGSHPGCSTSTSTVSWPFSSTDLAISVPGCIC